MKKYLLFGMLVLVAVFGWGYMVEAMTPTISVVVLGSTESAQVTVHGDPYSSISLSYYGSSSYYGPTSVGTIGTTDANGNFSTILSSRTYGIPSGATAYVTVNNQRSPQILWPNWSQSGSVSQISYAPIPLYQPSYPYGYNAYSSYYQPQNYCYVQYAIQLAPCQQQYVSGQYAYPYSYNYSYPYSYQQYTYSPLSVNPSYVTLQAGQTTTASLSGGMGNLYVSSVTNSNVVRATISGSWLTLTGLMPGTSNVTIGSYNGGASVTMSVNVTGSVNQTYYPNYYYPYQDQYYYQYPYQYQYQQQSYTIPTTYYGNSWY